ncbi:MAG: AbgT family transporter [Actinobacteria bacterium]|nr:AbgT family transporter [Actinomycetota bacterium]
MQPKKAQASPSAQLIPAPVHVARPDEHADGRGKPIGILDLIERVGNKVPHPAILFVALCVAVIILSQVLYLAGRRPHHHRGGHADRPHRPPAHIRPRLTPSYCP